VRAAVQCWRGTWCRRNGDAYGDRRGVAGHATHGTDSPGNGRVSPHDWTAAGWPSASVPSGGSEVPVSDELLFPRRDAFRWCRREPVRDGAPGGHFEGDEGVDPLSSDAGVLGPAVSLPAACAPGTGQEPLRDHP